MFRGKKWEKMRKKKTVEERNRIRSAAAKKGWKSRKLMKKQIEIQKKLDALPK